MLLSIIAFLLVLSVLVAVHELGHMLAAKACGVAVPEFAIGFGPTIFSFKRGETKYCLNIVPLGGYCAIAGLAEDVVDAPGADTSTWNFPTHRTWQAKNGWQKAFMLVGGPLMNFLLALIVVIVIGFIGFPTNAIMIGEVKAGAPAAEAGLQPNDIVLELAGEPIHNDQLFKAIVQDHLNRELTMLVQRGKEQVTLTAVPRVIEGFNEDQASLGISLGETLYSTTKVVLVQPKSIGYDLKLRVGDVITAVDGEPINNGFELLFSLASFNKDLKAIGPDGAVLAPGEGTPVDISVERDGEILALTIPPGTTPISLGVQFEPYLEQLPIGQSVLRSLEEAMFMTLATVTVAKMMFTSEGAKSMAGPVGIFNMVGQSVHSGMYTFLQLVMMISFSLGLFNLLPLPALDGGRLVFVALNGIGIRVPPKREMAIHVVGFMMIIGLVLLMTFFDVMALVKYNQP